MLPLSLNFNYIIMKKSPIILILLAIISFTGCKRNASETQKTLTSSGSTAVIEQVEKMYNEVFGYYNKRDFKTIKNGKKFFSKKLKTLWEELPADYAVIDADPWTWTQEPDSFVFQTVKLNRLAKDSAVVKTTAQCFGHISTKAGDVYDCGISQMTLRLVREDGRWFVDDFRDKDERPHSSLTHMIQDFKREQEASRRVEAIYNGLFACQNKNEDFDTDSYISTNLKTLWESLPENELVYSANVWTGLQDFDSLILEGSGADGQRNGWRRDERRKDTIVVSVRFRAFDGGEINTAHVKMVYERNGWYIDDIVHTFKGEEYSIVEIAKMQIPDSVAYYYKAATNGESNIIELKYKDGEITDGYFWGTSDEFCDAREGYYPGFAVWPMKEIQVNDNILTFLIDSRGETYSSGPVSVEIHSMAEAFEKGYHPWMQKSRFFQDTVRYTCTLMSKVLILNGKSKYYTDSSIFKKMLLKELKEQDRSCGYEEENRQEEKSLGNISPKEVHPVSDISKAEFERLYNLFDTGKLPLEEWKKYGDDIIYRDLYSEACSWYCRGNVFSLTASSQLQADKDSAYTAKNAHDSNHESVWIEGGDGQGIGEYLLYEFAGMCPRINTVKILNGHVKSDKDWCNWSRVKLLKMYYNETDYAILELEDSRTLQCFDVGLLGYNDKNAANWTLKFEILDVYPGEKYDDTAISELYFDGVDVH